MTKAKNKKSMMEPKTKPPKAPKSKAIGPYVEPTFVRADQIGVTPVHKRKRAAVHPVEPATVRLAQKIAKKHADGKTRAAMRIYNQRKCRIFDLMIDFTAMRNASLMGARIQCQVIDSYKDHTDIIADRPGAPGVQFDWLVPSGERGNHVLTILSEEWEFTNVADGLAAVQSHIRDTLETERKRDEVLRRLSPEERRLLGKEDWRDPLEEERIDENEHDLSEDEDD